MDTLYSTSQPYAVYDAHHRWTDDSKNNYLGDHHDITLSNKSLEAAHIVNPASIPQNVASSMLKVEDEISAGTTPTAVSSQMWNERLNDTHPIRSFSTSHASALGGPGQSFVQVNNPAFSLQHAHTWSVPHSGATTPTPLYSQVFEMPFTNNGANGFTPYPHDPPSAVSMSPQSSQGGWASAASSDGTDQRGMISPIYRPTSPGTVVRPDGIRKKNARFEIPKERNLANIDAMILASTDENEKKELKQQKRLLRNRQAALDSRQRKKTHTEKLEQEKKVSEKKMVDMEEGLARLESVLALEREQYIQQRQHMENLIHVLQYDRDEAIRTKTLETAELRRQINLLKECVRDMERQQNKSYTPVSNISHYNNNVSDYGFEESWDDEPNWMHQDDLKMDDHDALQRQATPKPLAPSTKPVESKTDAGFSIATFYTCLLFGAFIAANSNIKVLDNTAASALTSVPPIEASNVIKSVMSSGSVATSDVLSSGDEVLSEGAVDGRSRPHSSYDDAQVRPSSSLDHLHQTLSSPTRRQEMAAAFSMSASSYQHLTDPFNEHLSIDADHDILEPPPAPQPSVFQKAYASMQAQKENLDRITGMGSKARDRSLLWDQVPPEVIKNFEALIQSNANHNNNNKSVERMEQ